MKKSSSSTMLAEKEEKPAKSPMVKEKMKLIFKMK